LAIVLRLHGGGMRLVEMPMSASVLFFVMLPARLAVVLAISCSRPAAWAKWRDATFCVLRTLDTILALFTARAQALVMAKSAVDRWSTWVSFFVLQGGHALNNFLFPLVYRVRFSVGFPLQVLQLGASLATMRWALLDTAKQYYGDYLDGAQTICLGADGNSCFASFAWFRLIFVGFLLPCYIVLKQELRSRRDFINLSRLHGHMPVLKCEVVPALGMGLTYAIIGGTLVGQGHSMLMWIPL
jgi:hypothetical protein